MRFTEARIPGVWRIGLEKREDSRGFFARVFCEERVCRAWARHAISAMQPDLQRKARDASRHALSAAAQAGSEGSAMSRGAVYDVLLDLRPDSPMYLKYEAFELTGDNRESLYVPEGIAHGFQTLTDDVEMFYQMSEVYTPALNDGVRWDDPAFAIEWPLSDPILSDKDKSYPDYRESPWAR